MDAFSHLLGQPDTDGRIFGVVIALVTNTKDPDGLGRAKVKLPWLADDAESDWARVATPMAGKDRGFFMLPEVDDEVLVAFGHGNPEVPYVLAGLWNAKDKPPESNSDGKNDVRVIKSRSGHVIRLTDKDKEEKIEVIAKGGNSKIEIDDDTIAITAKKLELKGTDSVKITGKTVELNP